ncbi:RHS domain-containing protein [bacterium]|nr:RHS domain-containing protein [bacterium]
MTSRFSANFATSKGYRKKVTVPYFLWLGWRPLVLIVPEEAQGDDDTGDDDTVPATTFNVYAIHTDHLGTPLKMSNAEGDVVWEMDLDPFGKVYSLDEDVDEDDFSTVQSLRMPVTQSDDESQLLYVTSVGYYDSEVSKFESPVLKILPYSLYSVSVYAPFANDIINSRSNYKSGAKGGWGIRFGWDLVRDWVQDQYENWAAGCVNIRTNCQSACSDPGGVIEYNGVIYYDPNPFNDCEYPGSPDGAMMHCVCDCVRSVASWLCQVHLGCV